MRLPIITTGSLHHPQRSVLIPSRKPRYSAAIRETTFEFLDRVQDLENLTNRDDQYDERIYNLLFSTYNKVQQRAATLLEAYTPDSRWSTSI